MKKLLRFELLKVKRNYFYPMAAGLFVGIIFIYGFLFYAYPTDFVTEQKQVAMDMIETINQSDQNDNPEIMKEKELYTNILDATSWQDVYLILNDIDELFIQSPHIIAKNQTDLHYDYKTNIELRNRDIQHNISPDDTTGGIFLNQLFTKLLDFIIPVFIFLIAAAMFISEYENKTILYLYTLDISHFKIIISKLLSIYMVQFIVIAFPLIACYILTSLAFGFSNPHTLIQSSYQIGQVHINNDSFLQIYPYLFSLLLILFLNIIFISNITCFFSTIIRNKNIAMLITMFVLIMCMVVNFLVPMSRVHFSTFSILDLLLFTGVISFVTVVKMVHHLKKRDVV